MDAGADEHSWLFDLIDPDPGRRAVAIDRYLGLKSQWRGAIRWQNDVRQRAGRKGISSYPALLAEMDQARAAQSAALRSTLFGPVCAFCQAGWSGSPEDHGRYGPYAVLFLQWETRFPDEWYRTSIGRWGIKKDILRRFRKAGSTPETHADLIELLTAAVYREHRCEDGGYAALARRLDGPDLRGRLADAQNDHDGLVRLRAGYVQWVIDHPDAPVNVSGWRRWLADYDTPSLVTSHDHGEKERP